jgi:hypothetical protein
MTWKEFVKQWKPSRLIEMKVPESTVFAWHAGTKEPKGWQREAAAFWIDAKAGEKLSSPPVKRKSGKPGADSAR